MNEKDITVEDNLKSINELILSILGKLECISIEDPLKAGITLMEVIEKFLKILLIEKDDDQKKSVLGLITKIVGINISTCSNDE